MFVLCFLWNVSITPVIRQTGELRLLVSTTTCHQVHGKVSICGFSREQGTRASHSREYFSLKLIWNSLASTSDFVQFYGKVSREAGPEIWLGGGRVVADNIQFCPNFHPLPRIWQDDGVKETSTCNQWNQVESVSASDDFWPRLYSCFHLLFKTLLNNKF